MGIRDGGRSDKENAKLTTMRYSSKSTAAAFLQARQTVPFRSSDTHNHQLSVPSDAALRTFERAQALGTKLGAARDFYSWWGSNSGNSGYSLYQHCSHSSDRGASPVRMPSAEPPQSSPQASSPPTQAQHNSSHWSVSKAFSRLNADWCASGWSVSDASSRQNPPPATLGSDLGFAQLWSMDPSDEALGYGGLFGDTDAQPVAWDEKKNGLPAGTDLYKVGYVQDPVVASQQDAWSLASTSHRFASISRDSSQLQTRDSSFSEHDQQAHSWDYIGRYQHFRTSEVVDRGSDARPESRSPSMLPAEWPVDVGQAWGHGEVAPFEGFMRIPTFPSSEHQSVRDAPCIGEGWHLDHSSPPWTNANWSCDLSLGVGSLWGAAASDSHPGAADVAPRRRSYAVVIGPLWLPPQERAGDCGIGYEEVCAGMGLRITTVYRGTTLYQHGLIAGDVVVAVNGQPVICLEPREVVPLLCAPPTKLGTTLNILRNVPVIVDRHAIVEFDVILGRKPGGDFGFTPAPILMNSAARYAVAPDYDPKIFAFAINLEGRGLPIVRVTANTDAFSCNVTRGDVLVKVNQIDVAQMSSQDACAMARVAATNQAVLFQFHQWAFPGYAPGEWASASDDTVVRTEPVRIYALFTFQRALFHQPPPLIDSPQEADIGSGDHSAWRGGQALHPAAILREYQRDVVVQVDSRYQSLGLILSGSMISKDMDLSAFTYAQKGMLVAGVRPGSPAAQCGIGGGDAIVAINGVDIRKASFATASDILGRSSSGRNSVQLTMFHAFRAMPTDFVAEEQQVVPRDGQRVRLAISRSPNGSFGFTPAATMLPSDLCVVATAGLIVAQVRPHGPAWQTGMREGDVVVAVNSRSLAEVSYGQAIDIITQAEGPVVEFDLIRPSAPLPRWMLAPAVHKESLLTRESIPQSGIPSSFQQWIPIAPTHAPTLQVQSQDEARCGVQPLQYQQQQPYHAEQTYYQPFYQQPNGEHGSIAIGPRWQPTSFQNGVEGDYLRPRSPIDPEPSFGPRHQAVLPAPVPENRARRAEVPEAEMAPASLDTTSARGPPNDAPFAEVQRRMLAHHKERQQLLDREDQLSVEMGVLDHGTHSVPPQDPPIGPNTSVSTDGSGGDGFAPLLAPSKLHAPTVLHASRHKVRTNEIQIIRRADGIGLVADENNHDPLRLGMRVKEIRSGSAADEAGLKTGDLVVAVDGDPLEGCSFEECTRIIRDGKNAVVRLSVSRPPENRHDNPDIVLQHTQVLVIRLKRGSVDFNFGAGFTTTKHCLQPGNDFSGVHSAAKRGLPIIQVVPNSPAAEAGMRVGDVIVGVAERQVAHMKAAEILMLMESVVGDVMQLTVVHPYTALPVDLRGGLLIKGLRFRPPATSTQRAKTMFFIGCLFFFIALANVVLHFRHDRRVVRRWAKYSAVSLVVHVIFAVVGVLLLLRFSS